MRKTKKLSHEEVMRLVPLWIKVILGAELGRMLDAEKVDGLGEELARAMMNQSEESKEVFVGLTADFLGLCAYMIENEQSPSDVNKLIDRLSKVGDFEALEHHCKSMSAGRLELSEEAKTYRDDAIAGMRKRLGIEVRTKAGAAGSTTKAEQKVEDMYLWLKDLIPEFEEKNGKAYRVLPDGKIILETGFMDFVINNLGENASSPKTLRQKIVGAIKAHIEK